MAPFDVCRLRSGGMVLDCQDGIFDSIGTRFVVPMVSDGKGAPQTARLHPAFQVNGETLVMMTEFATAIRTSELQERVASLSHERLRIIAAIDVLTGSG